MSNERWVMSNERWVMSDEQSMISNTPGFLGRIRIKLGKNARRRAYNRGDMGII